MAADRGHLISGAGQTIRRRPHAPGRPFRFLLHASIACEGPAPDFRSARPGSGLESQRAPSLRIPGEIRPWLRMARQARIDR